MDRRRHLHVNQYESLTDEILVGVADRYDARVCPKVRIADALNINQSGISNEQFTYALKAHFDFVIIDENSLASFAVEFDEPHHIKDRDAIVRDRMKGEICNNLGLPLLRIGSQGLEEIDDATVLAWIADTYFIRQAFLLAQAQKLIPLDAEFEWRMFLPLQDGSQGNSKVYPFGKCYEMIQDAIAEGLILAPEPLVINLNVPPLYFEAFAGVPMKNGCFLFERARFRFFGPFVSIYPWEVSEQLAIAALARKVDLFLKGEYLPSKTDTHDVFIESVAAEYHRTRRKSLDDPIPPRKPPFH